MLAVSLLQLIYREWASALTLPSPAQCQMTALVAARATTSGGVSGGGGEGAAGQVVPIILEEGQNYVFAPIISGKSTFAAPLFRPKTPPPS